MKLKPVAVKTRPAYPTRSEFLAADPISKGRQAVERHGEQRPWGKDLAAAATFFIAISIGGCDTSWALEADNSAKQTVEQSAEKQIKSKTVVAPIFEHGRGHGVTGCLVMTPPSFLSEDEAMQVIKDELSKHGIKLEDGEKLQDVIVQIPCHNRYGALDSELKKQPQLIMPRPLEVDAINKEKNIAVEYVSKSDCKSFELPSYYLSSVSRFTSKKVASDLAESAQKSGDHRRYLGFFYDPMALSKLELDPKKLAERRKALLSGKIPAKQDDTEQDNKTKKPEKRLTYKEEKQQRKEVSKELLRRQVHDFAVWLDKQGVDVRAEEPEIRPRST